MMEDLVKLHKQEAYRIKALDLDKLRYPSYLGGVTLVINPDEVEFIHAEDFKIALQKYENSSTYIRKVAGYYLVKLNSLCYISSEEPDLFFIRDMTSAHSIQTLYTFWKHEYGSAYFLIRDGR